MCGIAGFVSQVPAEVQRLQLMTDQLVHRGPDDVGHWCYENVGLGHRRLAIMDLSSAGHQPMHSGDGNWVIIFNGEIYNAASLAQELNAPLRGHSDTEVLVEAISRWGVKETVPRLIGMFAFAVFHIPSKRLFLCRDRLGIKPLYWGWIGNELAFASEVHAFKGWRDKLEVNRDAVASFLRYGYTPAPSSIYSQIHKLEPATILELSAAVGAQVKLTHTTYWDLPEIAGQISSVKPEEELLEELHAVMKQAVKDRMIADVPLGAFLSGGIDSSLVCALMQEQTTQKVKTFTIGFEHPDFNEALHAKSVADHLGTEHTELYISEKEVLATVDKLFHLLDEPFADSSLLPTFLVSQLARQHVTVALSGDGGDELFWGYHRYATTQALWRKIRRVPKPVRGLIRTITTNGTVQGLTRNIPAPSWGGRKASLNQKLKSAGELIGCESEQSLYHGMMSQFKDPESFLLTGHSLPTAYNQSSHWSQRHHGMARMAWQDTVVYLPDDILTKVDRASMRVSLEARVPLLDHRIVELAARLPSTMKTRPGQPKYALAELLARYVPRDVTDRPKMGFGVPLHDWIRGPLREWTCDLLSEQSLRFTGLFNEQSVQSLLTHHMNGTANNASKLWNVLMIQYWLTANSVR